MPSISNMPLETYGDGPAALAVGFLLNRPAARSRVTNSTNGWEVELREGSASVAARTSADGDDEAALENAIDAVNEALDLAAVIDGNVLLTKRAIDEFIIYRRQPRASLAVQLLLDWPMNVGPVEITHVLADGTIERPAEQMPTAWSPAFRFFRLSQASDDLFEAYRNMFLALEAVFSQLYPTRSGEREKDWLIRALRGVSRSIDLTPYLLAPAVDEARALADTFYSIRVQLFHAKQGRSILPGSPVSHSSVADAYRSLARFWRALVAHDLGASASGGVVTHVGFRMMMENALREMRFAVSGDTTPVSREQEHLSQSGGHVITFSSPVALAEERGGRIQVRGTEPNPGGRLGVIGRSGLVTDDSGSLVIVSDDFAPIDTNGVDELTMQFTMRLVNTSQIRTEF